MQHTRLNKEIKRCVLFLKTRTRHKIIPHKQTYWLKFIKITRIFQSNNVSPFVRISWENHGSFHAEWLFVGTTPKIHTSPRHKDVLWRSMCLPNRRLCTGTKPFHTFNLLGSTNHWTHRTALSKYSQQTATLNN